MIHRTAVVDSKAQIDSDAVVGPYALIEGPVQISSGTEIQGHAVITGLVQIGKNNRIGYGAVIGAFPQDLSFDPNARIMSYASTAPSIGAREKAQILSSDRTTF
jgi:acyl-[acyl carrier protein]--UDP-N-acetylglucosamine O-acyltransferase